MNATMDQTLPPFTALTLGRTLMLGVGGLIIWEFFARLVAPIWIGFALDPTALIGMALGVEGIAAQALHIATGLMFFPIGYLFVVHPLARRVAPGLSWLAVGAAYGIALWIFAMYVLASLLGGAPPFLGFEPVAWASLAGHVAIGIAIAATNMVLPDNAA